MNEWMNIYWLYIEMQTVTYIHNINDKQRL